MAVNSRLRATAALPPGKERPVSIERKVVWVSADVDVLEKGKISSASSLDYSVLQPVALLLYRLKYPGSAYELCSLQV